MKLQKTRTKVKAETVMAKSGDPSAYPEQDFVCEICKLRLAKCRDVIKGVVKWSCLECIKDCACKIAVTSEAEGAQDPEWFERDDSDD